MKSLPGLWLLVVVTFAMHHSATVAAEAPTPFNNLRALLSMGQNDRIYLAGSNGDSVLHCKRDGSDPVLGKTAYALTGATANKDGIMAAGHAHFAHNVSLYDADYNTIGRFSRLDGSTFSAPGGVEAGPSGDFYALDQQRDQIIRFHPDGVRAAIYQIPHQEYEDKRHGFLTRFRVNEQTNSLYALNWQSLRCFDISGTGFRFTPKLKWEMKQPHTAMMLSYGYGGFAVDEKGVLYMIGAFDEFITSYSADGNELQKFALQVGDHKFADPTRVLGLAVSKGEAFVKRQHETEMFLRFNLATGEVMNVATLPADTAAIFRVPTDVNAGKLVPPVKSTLGIPAGRKILRVLFIGNSQVNCVRDIPDMIEEISRTNPDSKAPIVVIDEVLVPGTGLEGYWTEGLGRKRILGGGWDYVVINDIAYSFGITNHDKFMEYAGKFDAAAKTAGTKIVVFATGDIDKKREQHAIMYQDGVELAQKHKGRVAGAGMAWLKAWDKKPELDFHYTDRAHPSALGCYFNALVLYAALTDSNPKSAKTSLCDAANAEEATLLQEIAWQQYIEDRKMEKVTPLK